MTIVVLARSAELPPVLARWAHAAEDVVVFTARPPAVTAPLAVPPTVDVRYVGDYADSATVDLNVTTLARSRGVSAIAVADAADLIRAGALRDYLGIPGQGRESAVTFHDLVRLRRALAHAAVPTVSCEPVRRPADIFLAASQRGLPLRVRQRRAVGWPAVALLDSFEAMRGFTRDGLGVAPGAVPSLLVETPVDGGRHKVIGEVTDGEAVITSGGPGNGMATAGAGGAGTVAGLARAALAALPTPTGQTYSVEVVRTVDGRLLVDNVAAAAAAVAPGRPVITPLPEYADAPHMTEKVPL